MKYCLSVKSRIAFSKNVYKSVTWRKTVNILNVPEHHNKWFVYMFTGTCGKSNNLFLHLFVVVLKVQNIIL